MNMGLRKKKDAANIQFCHKAKQAHLLKDTDPILPTWMPEDHKRCRFNELINLLTRSYDRMRFMSSELTAQFLISSSCCPVSSSNILLTPPHTTQRDD